MAAESDCGSIYSRGSLQELPDDVLALVSAMISPQDLMRLSATCRKLRDVCSADKLWLPQCNQINSGIDLYSWRKGVDSYRALFRFMISVRSLVGLWVHQNPELGNLVFVTWGFVSVVGVRIIPQEVGPQGLDRGLLWAPVFEILGHPDGSLALFLHGRENKKDFCYPGRFSQSTSKCPNVLLLEAEPLLRQCSSLNGSPRSPNSPLSAETSEDSAGEEFTKRPSKSLKVGCKEKRRKVPSEQVTFKDLGFGDRRRLLEHLAPEVALQVPGLASGALFPRWSGKNVGLQPDLYQRDLVMLAKRRERLLWMYRFGKPTSLAQDSESELPGSSCQGVPSDFLLNHLCKPEEEKECPPEEGARAKLRSASFKGDRSLIADSGTTGLVDGWRKNSLARLFVDKMKSLIGKNGEESRMVASSAAAVSSSSAQLKRQRLQEFLKQSKNVGLLLNAATLKLDFYRAWPIMYNNNQFALYKIPEQRPVEGRDYAGLWGGTLGRPSENKPGRALFFLLLSYDESEEGRLLIATKILEGTHYVMHPNGSAMFTAKVDEFSSEPFPWETGTDGLPVDIVSKFQGEGIANGYGFRYPGSKPGDLFVHGNGLLSFVWRESRAVLTMERLNLQRLIESGERVPALPHVANFAYLTKSYSNVFAGSCGAPAITFGTLTPGSLVTPPETVLSLVRNDEFEVSQSCNFYQLELFTSFLA
ncbi:hypothetical protein R1sor_027274 [Riccia sorocarpa]|uniref:F-box domain-containing protein n=1 Tax=Riccia sorocarpa TaxID=122646 RepID=A0ABD3GFE9_9MARC